MRCFNMTKLETKQEKLQYEIYGKGKFADVDILLAKVKSKGLAYIIANNLEETGLYHDTKIR